MNERNITLGGVVVEDLAEEHRNQRNEDLDGVPNVEFCPEVEGRKNPVEASVVEEMKSSVESLSL